MDIKSLLKFAVFILTIVIWVIATYWLSFPLRAETMAKTSYTFLSENKLAFAEATALRGIEYDPHNVSANYYYGLVKGLEYGQRVNMPEHERKKLLQLSIKHLKIAVRLRLDPMIYHNLATSYGLLGDYKKMIIFNNLQYFYSEKSKLQLKLERMDKDLVRISESMFQKGEYWPAMLIARNLAKISPFQEKNKKGRVSVNAFVINLWQKIIIHSNEHFDPLSKELIQKWIRELTQELSDDAIDNIVRSLSIKGLRHLAVVVSRVTMAGDFAQPGLS